MVWIVEKKIFYHILDLGYESVGIPIRVKFEFDVVQGAFVPESLSFEHLYNRKALLLRYPNLQAERLEQDIRQTVNRQIRKYLHRNGYLGDDARCNTKH